MADPLVLLHGFTGRGPSWDPVLQELKGQDLLRPVDGWSPDLPGHGSSNVVRPESFEATVEALAEEMERRFSDPVVLVGYSLGGRLGLGVALRRPERVRRLILIGVNPGIETVDERRSRAGADAQLADRLVAHGMEDFVTYWQSLPLFESQNRLSARVLVRQSEIRRSHRPDGLAWAVRTLSPGLMPNYRPALQAWDGCPVTWVSGADDEKFDRLAAQIASVSECFEHRSLPGLGHNPVLEAPRAIAELIADSLRAAGGGPA